MRRHRPGSVITFAVLNLVFGGLFLICGVVNTQESSQLKTTVGNRVVDVAEEFRDFLADEIPGYAVWRVGSLVTSLLLGVGFVASGVGLLLFKGWGQILGVVCAGLSLLQQFALLIFQFTLYNPAARKFGTIGPYGLVAGLDYGFRTFLTVTWAMIVIVYTVVVLIVMLQPATTRALRDASEGAEDWEDDRPRRRPRPRDEYDEDDFPPRRPPRRAEDFRDEPPRRRPMRRPDEDDDY